MFDKKLVAVMNKSLEPGKAMNALSHMSIGLGAKLGSEVLKLDTYVDFDKNQYPNISDYPFIILKASGNKVKNLVNTAISQNIEFTAFTDTMTIGTYIEQHERTKNTKQDDLVFYGCLLFGEIEMLNELTKKFSLY